METYHFHSDIIEIMSEMINTFDANGIFLQELISNANNALKQYELDNDGTEFESYSWIKIIPDKEDNTITIIDNGVGMTKFQLASLGSYVPPTTISYVKALRSGEDISMKQKGPGIYSAFMVANTVTITSKQNNGYQYIWECSGGNKFTIGRDGNKHWTWNKDCPSHEDGSVL